MLAEIEEQKDSERRVSVYVLRDADGSARYVGQTTNITRRMWHHWRKNRFPDEKGNRRLNDWLAALDAKPECSILEIAPYSLRFAVEREWTLALRESGHDLLNIAVGSSIAPETAQKLADAKRGRPLTAEHRANIGAALRGAGKDPEEKPARTLSPEHRAKLLEANRGRKVSDETKAQISESLRGHAVSEETRAKIGEASRGRMLSPEARAKIGAAQRGKPKSPETKARMREAHLRRIARKRAEREGAD